MGCCSVSMAASFREARRYERAPVREPVVILWQNHRFRGLVTRIGGGGVYVVTDAPTEVDDRILLRMRLPCFDAPVVFKGEVRWSSPPRTREDGSYHPGGVGVMFLDVDPQIRQKIIEFVTDTGDMLFEVSGLLDNRDPDVARIQAMLSRVSLDTIGSLDELRSRLRAELDQYFRDRG